MLAKVSANIKTVQTYQLNGQLPDNPSCKDESSRQPASFCLESRKRKKKKQLLKKKIWDLSLNPQRKPCFQINVCVWVLHHDLHLKCRSLNCTVIVDTDYKQSQYKEKEKTYSCFTDISTRQA